MNSLNWKPPLGYLGIVKTVSIANVLYAAPKILSMICTRPQHRDHSLPDRIRERIIVSQENLREIFGETNWMVLTNVVADNAWIGFLAVTYFTNGAPLFASFDRGLNEIGSFFSTCIVAWLVRIAISEAFPRTAPHLGFTRR